MRKLPIDIFPENIVYLKLNTYYTYTYAGVSTLLILNISK